MSLINSLMYDYVLFHKELTNEMNKHYHTARTVIFFFNLLPRIRLKK